MDFTEVKKWIIFFLGILCAIVIANALSNMIMNNSGVTGWVNFAVNFILYAVFFFGILYMMEKLLGIDFFGFGRH